METCSEIDRSDDVLMWENLLDFENLPLEIRTVQKFLEVLGKIKFSYPLEKYQDLQEKYFTLVESYTKEIENSKKIKKSLEKCLKFYSKLSKKCEAQREIIDNLEKTNKEKINCLEESFKNQEKMKGLIDIYKTERCLYSGESTLDLKRDKEILLDICCQLISESVKTNNTRNIVNLILRKFRKDLSNDKLNLLKGKQVIVKKEINKTEPSNYQDVKLLKKMDLSTKMCDTESDNEFKKEKESFLINSCDYNLNLDYKQCVNETQITGGLCHQGGKVQKVEHLPESCINSKFTETSDKENDKNSNHFEEDHIEKSKVFSRKSLSEKEQTNGTLPPLEENIQIMSDFSDSEDNDDGTKAMQPKNKFNIINTCASSVKNSEIKREINSALESFKNNRAQDFSETQSNEKFTVLSEFSKKKINHQITSKCNTNNLNLSVQSVKNFENNKNCENNSRSHIISQVGFVNVLHPSKEEYKESEPLKLSNTGSINTKSKNSDNILASENKILQKNSYLELNRNTLEKKPDQSIFDIAETTSAEASKLRGEKKSTDSINVKEVENFFNFSSDSKNNSISFSSLEEESAIEIDKRIQGTTIERNVKIKLHDEKEREKMELNEDLSNIFNEMTTVRLLSPIREIDNKINKKFEANDLSTDTQSFIQPYNTKTIKCVANKNKITKLVKKRTFTALSTYPSKKFKKSEAPIRNLQQNPPGLLDSIMSAMSVQNEEFKSNTFNKEQSLDENTPLVEQKWENDTTKNNDLTMNFSMKNVTEKINLESNFCMNSSVEPFQVIKKNDDKQLENERIFLRKKIEEFISSPNESKEETSKNVNECIAVVKNMTKETIVSVIISIVFENVNEIVESNERPVPPLTKTQHRLIILLSILKKLDPKTEDIISAIMAKITEKLFPDQLFWPDKTVEMTSRFFIALCVNRNSSESIQAAWKFCYQAMTEMKERSCLVFFVALTTWPIMLHKASEMENNIMALTIVNVFLHMPMKNDCMSQKKLKPLKQLLTNFYEFKVDYTIEHHAVRLLDLFFNSDNAGKPLVLLSKYRDNNWIKKNILARLLATLKEWPTDTIGLKILGVIHQMIPNLCKNCKNFFSEESNIFKEIASCFSYILNCNKLHHESEVKVIKILLCMQQCQAAQKIIQEWKPKQPIDQNLRDEIMKISSENILRELKLNRKKDVLDRRNCNKIKRHGKNFERKSKKKKKKQGKKKVRNLKSRAKQNNKNFQLTGVKMQQNTQLIKT